MEFLKYKFIKISLILLIMLKSSNSEMNYCEQDLCSDGDVHVGCNNTEEFASKCGPQVRILPMIKKRRDLFVRIHNRYRDKIARGLIPGYSQAERMPAILWDFELARLAELNVKKCKVEHDDCRNTKKFSYVGQNIGIRMTYPKFKTYANTIRYIVDEWFSEYKNANQTFINNYMKHPEGLKIGHFTLMISDKVTRMGCASILFVNQETQRKTFIATCNYSFTNFIDQPVYKSGPTGSKCETGFNKYFKGLCSNREIVNSEPYLVEPEVIYV